MHWKSECWYNLVNQKGGKAKGKAGDSHGRSPSASGKGGAECFMCKQPGHVAKDCPKRTLHSIEEH
eukprot:12426812-Karenia_brevis.AAC.1